MPLFADLEPPPHGLVTLRARMLRRRKRAAAFAGLLVAPAAAAAAIVGDQIAYGIGRRSGEALFKREDSRWFKQSHLRAAHDFYEKHGGKTIILARFMPFARTFAPVVAGAAKAYAASSAVTLGYLGANVRMTGTRLTVGATGIDENFASATAGSGGVVAGAGDREAHLAGGTGRQPAGISAGRAAYRADRAAPAAPPVSGLGSGLDAALGVPVLRRADAGGRGRQAHAADPVGVRA